MLCSSVLGLDSMGSSLILPDHSLKAPLTPSRQRAGCLTARGLEEQKKKSVYRGEMFIVLSCFLLMLIDKILLSIGTDTERTAKNISACSKKAAKVRAG